jgi:hypothetical protein
MIDPKAQVNVLQLAGSLQAPGPPVVELSSCPKKPECLGRGKANRLILVSSEKPLARGTVRGMDAAQAILTSRRSDQNHAAVVARGLGVSLA